MKPKSTHTPTAEALRRSFYDHNRLCFVTAVVLTILSAPFYLIISWFLGETLDVIYDSNLQRLVWLVQVFVLVMLLSALVDWLMYVAKTRFIHKGLAQYKDAAFCRLSEKSISAFQKEHTGRYLSVLTNDANTIEENYLNQPIYMVKNVLMFVGSLAMIFYYSWKLSLVAIGMSLLPILSSVLMGTELTKRETAVSDQNERFVSSVKDLLSGFSVIKSFKAEKQAQMLYARENRETEHMKQRRRSWACLLDVINWDIASMLVQFSIFLVGALLAIRGEITAGAVLIVTNLCNFIMQPIQNVPRWWANRKAAVALIDKMAELLDENTDRSGAPVAPELCDAITLKHVGFGYSPEVPVLQDVNLTLEAGKKYAIVGGSGSGKTTLLNLLMGAYEGYSGSITLDGKELREIAPDSLYDVMSLIGQNVFLFDDTIQNNITMFRDFPAAQVQQAATRAGLAPLLAERGADYRCGENGAGLSGGERQRVSIARCLLRGTPVLLLDEATAALDARTAFDVTDAILHLDGLTRVVVTHRLEPGLMEQYDGVIVLRGGTVCECGTFEQLMAQKGYFYSLYHVTAAAA